MREQTVREETAREERVREETVREATARKDTVRLEAAVKLSAIGNSGELRNGTWVMWRSYRGPRAILDEDRIEKCTGK